MKGAILLAILLLSSTSMAWRIWLCDDDHGVHRCTPIGWTFSTSTTSTTTRPAITPLALPLRTGRSARSTDGSTTLSLADQKAYTVNKQLIQPLQMDLTKATAPKPITTQSKETSIFQEIAPTKPLETTLAPLIAPMKTVPPKPMTFRTTQPIMTADTVTTTTTASPSMTSKTPEMGPTEPTTTSTDKPMKTAAPKLMTNAITQPMVTPPIETIWISPPEPVTTNSGNSTSTFAIKLMKTTAPRPRTSPSATNTDNFPATPKQTNLEEETMEEVEATPFPASGAAGLLCIIGVDLAITFLFFLTAFGVLYIMRE